MKIRLLSIIFFIILLPASIQAANDSTRNRWQNIKDYTKGIIHSASAGVEYRVKAGIALGGTAPIPLAPEIRGINSFNPLVNISIEAEILKTISEDGGLSFGLRLETKGMETDALVKNYSMKMVYGDSEIAGVWYGNVETKVSITYLTLPVLAVWKPSERWDIKIGPYLSYMLYGNFSGGAYNGYLRVGSPIGEKLEIDDKAGYDFSSDLRRTNWGVQIGADWRAFPHFLIGMDLKWGLNSIFKKRFDTISFNMYPIYLSLNFGYAF